MTRATDGSVLGFDKIANLLEISQSKLFEHTATVQNVAKFTAQEQYVVMASVMGTEIGNGTTANQITLHKPHTDEYILVQITEEDDEVQYENLPEELQELLFNYSKEELLQDPVTVVKSIIRMQAALQGGRRALVDQLDEESKVEGNMTG